MLIFCKYLLSILFLLTTPLIFIGYQSSPEQVLYNEPSIETDNFKINQFCIAENDDIQEEEEEHRTGRHRLGSTSVKSIRRTDLYLSGTQHTASQTIPHSTFLSRFYLRI